MIAFEPRTVSPDALLLDPNNYRFHDVPTYKQVGNGARYAEEAVQSRALQLLSTHEPFELGSLKDSILTNGFVPLEQIVVERYDGEGDKARYLVVEGNRRVAAVKTLLYDQSVGAVDIPPSVFETLQKLRVIELVGTALERRDYQQILMAIRHIAGIREWGPYQQAKLVVELFEKGGQTFSTVAQKIGIGAREVARRYRASKALQQMEEDEEFGEFAYPKLYSFFHEAVSQPKVRDWLSFSDQCYTAENEDARRTFYELLSPRSVDGETLPAKLQNANRQVRQLKDIVDKPVPLTILADPEKSFEDAVRAAESEVVPNEAGVLEHSLGVCLNSLRQPSIDAWLGADDKCKVLWVELSQMVDKIRPLMAKL